MTTIKRSAHVSYTPSQMFELVNAIDEYPRFVPWCKDAKIISQNSDEIHATLEFARGGLHKSFTTCNRLQPHKIIEMRLINGPFKHLEGFWRFDKVENGTMITFDLEFEFSNKILSLAFGPVFNQIANMLVDVFCQRANEVYGK